MITYRFAIRTDPRRPHVARDVVREYLVREDADQVLLEPLEDPAAFELSFRLAESHDQGLEELTYFLACQPAVTACHLYGLRHDEGALEMLNRLRDGMEVVE